MEKGSSANKNKKRERSASKKTSKKIGEFHTKLKEATPAEKNQILKTGLEDYQQTSLQGEAAGGGFDSSQYVFQQLLERRKGSKLTLLDVGAIVHRYGVDRCPVDLKIKATSIDLKSRDASVKQIDFFDFAKSKKEAFDVVVLSLVLNFLGTAQERGQMLVKTAQILKPKGLVFIVLPAQCISNSRYFKFAYLSRILKRVGLHICDEGKAFKSTEKLFFVVAQKGECVIGNPGFESEAIYRRKMARGGEDRNNFVILLKSEELKERSIRSAPTQEVDYGTKGVPQTSNQRKKARMRKKKEMAAAAAAAAEGASSKKAKVQEEDDEDQEEPEDEAIYDSGE